MTGLPWSSRVAGLAALLLVATLVTIAALPDGPPPAAPRRATPPPAPSDVFIADRESFGPAATTPAPGPAERGSSSAPTRSPAGSRGAPAVNTSVGVPAGVKFAARQGDLHVTAAGTVVDRLLVTGTVFVEADNVTIRRSKVVSPGRTFAVRQMPGVRNLAIEDSELAGAGGDVVDYGIRQEGPGLTVHRTEIHHADKGVLVGPGATIAASHIHDVTSYGVFSGGGTPDLVIRDSSILHPKASGVAVALYVNNGPQRTVVVADNLLGGGRYVLSAGQGDGCGEIRVTGNRFSRELFPAGGADGVAVAWDPQAPGNVWSGNRWADTGAVVHPV